MVRHNRAGRKLGPSPEVEGCSGVEAARERIAIMPGGGVRAQNVQQILEQTGACEIHSSLGMVSGRIEESSASQSGPDSGQVADFSEFEQRAREIKGILENVSA